MKRNKSILDIDITKLDIDSFLDNYLNKLLEKRKIVSSQDYFNWIINEAITADCPCLWDDQYLYSDDVNEKQKKYTELLSSFYEFIDELYSNNNLECESPESMFFTTILYFKLNNTFYKLENVYGQGTVTSLEKIDIKPNFFIEI